MLFDPSVFSSFRLIYLSILTNYKIIFRGSWDIKYLARSLRNKVKRLNISSSCSEPYNVESPLHAWMILVSMVRGSCPTHIQNRMIHEPISVSTWLSFKEFVSSNLYDHVKQILALELWADCVLYSGPSINAQQKCESSLGQIASNLLLATK